MKKRIMALILCISILCGLLPSDVYAVSPEVAGEKTTLSGNSAHSGESEESEEVEEAEVTEVNQLGYFNVTSVKLYYDLGTPEQYEELTSESDSWPVAFMVLSSMVYNEETWYILENDFTGNGATFVNSESVSLGTPEFEKYTGDGNIDDTAVFDTESYLNFVVTEDPTTYQHDLTSSGYISSLEPDDIFDLTAEENIFTMIITDYYWDSNSSALWYQVEAAEGSSLPEAMGNKSWVFQCYTHDAMQAGAANRLIITETVKDICDVCGKENCTDSLHFYCTVCEVYNCGLEHLYCNVCSDYDCDKTHVYCGICADYDCGLEHEEMNSPLTAPVISENPVMTEGEDVSLVDEYGNPVTAEDGMILSEGTKVSLSAWSELENTSDVSWQWQICYDNEKDLWADIYGQTGKGILLSPAMIFSVTGESGYAQIRCVMTAGEKTEISAAIPLMLAPQMEVFSVPTSDANLLADTEMDKEATNEDVTIYTVTIEYKYSSESKFNKLLVAQAYIAEFPAGITPSNTVISPNCVGYTPDIAQIDLSTLGALTEDKTITVYYSPAEVSYTVRHYQQNVDDDEYTWVNTTMAIGKTEALTSDDAAISYTGFTALPHYHEEIAADSSTTIDIYYDRNYYLMSFDLNGGYDVEAVYARYGAPVSVGTPTKAGYTFGGWRRNNDEDLIPTTMPAENRNYTALWSPGNTTYTIAYWLENPNTENVYDFVGTFSASANSGSSVSGSNSAVVNGIFTSDEVNYYSYNADKTDKNVTVSGNGSSVVNVYYDRNAYTLKFYYARKGKTAYDIAISTDGSSKENGTVANATWTGNFITKPTLDAKYTEQSEIINGNTYYYFTITAKYGASLSDLWPNAPLTAAGGYNFISWGTHYGSGYYKDNTNKNIKGVYSIMDSGLLIDPKVTAEQGVNHWLVGYWNTSPTMYTYEIYYTLLADEEADLTYNGVKYKKITQYKVGSTDLPSGQTALSFEGVYNVGKNYDENKQQDGTIIRFYYQRYMHTVTLDDGYGELQKYENIPFGDTLSAYLTGNLTPEYPEELPDGAYEFGGWYQSMEGIGELDTSITMSNEDLIYYAKWNPKVYTVTINDGNGTVLSTEQVNYGSKATKPTDPTMDDATFVGWYCVGADGKEQRYDFDNMTITQDMIIYAKWRSNVMKQVTVRYVLIDENGNEVGEVADSEVMMIRVGVTRTFEAKTGNSLYAKYRSGTFPITATTSITPTKEDTELTVTFCYKQYEAVAYNVEFYVELSDGTYRSAFWTVDNEVKFIGYDEDIPDGANAYIEYKEANPDNDKAIVTELYTPEIMSNTGWSLPDGYVPNALRIQRIIVPGENNAYNPDNTIVFIYTYNPNAALYSVNHYIQSSDGGDNYSLYTHKEYSESIDASVTDSYITIPGYSYSSAVTDVKKQTGTTLSTDGTTLSGIVNKQDSLELNFYYAVNQYPYQIMYLEKDTNRVLMDATTTDEDGNPLKANYGSQATYTLGTDEEKALLEDYEVDAASKSISIQMEAGDTASVNTIIFYYTRKSADLIVSKIVALDEEQAAETGISEIPDSALAQEFTYTITYPKGFYKSVYDCVITTVTENEDGTTSTTSTADTVIAQTTRMSFTLKHGQTIRIKDLDMGTYTITETYVPGFRITVNGNTAAQQREDVSIDAELIAVNQDVTVDFVNSYPFYTGELVLGKTVTKADSSDPDATEPYKVTVILEPYDDTREEERIIKWTEGETEKTFIVPKLTDKDATKFTFDVMVPVDGTVTLYGVPAGHFIAEEMSKSEIGIITDYYVVKTYSKLHNNEETIEGSGSVVAGVIHGGHATTVSFNNTYKKGNLTIKKIVTQEYENDNWKTDTFNFTITGTTELPAGIYNVVIGGETKTVTVDKGGNVSVETVNVSVTKPENTTDESWSNSLTIENLPAGYYVVKETEFDGYKCDTPTKNVTLGKDTTAEVVVTNTYPRTTGNLTINKNIENKSYDTITDEVFTFLVTMPEGVEIPEGGYSVSGGNFVAIADNSNQFKVTINASAGVMSTGSVRSATITGLPSGDYTVTEALTDEQISAGYTADFGNDTSNAKVEIRQSNETVTCTNTYEPESYIAVTKRLAFTENVTEVQKQNIISSYFGNPVEFNLLDNSGEIVAKAKVAIKGDGTFEKAKFMSVSDPSKAYFPVRNETYTVKETSTHNVSGFFWTHTAETLQVDENIEDVVYTNTYTRPEITITKNVSANDKDGNDLSKDKIKELIQTYGANGVYKATFNLLDHATNEEAGTLVISFTAGELTDEAKRTAKVELNADYLANHQNNADIKLIIQEDHTDGNTTIFGNDHPGVNFINNAADASDNLSQETDTDGQPVYVITLTKDNPDAQIICENVYPPVSYIAVQKKLEVKNDNAVIPEDIKEHYKKTPVVFTLYENYGEMTQKEVAHAYPQFDETTGTFTKATFVVDESGNPFVPVYGREYTIVETSLHRIGGYVWAKIGDTNSTVITVEASTTQPVVEKEFTNQYTPAAVGVEVEKTLVFYSDETGTTGLSPEQIKELLEKSDSGDNTYKATFGLYIVPNGETSEIDENCEKIGEATASFGIDDFKDSFTATKTLQFTGIKGTESAELEAYLKKLGASTEQTYLMINEDSASTIDGKPIDLEFEQTSFVLGGSDTDNQKYYNKATFENIYPPRLLTTSLKIVKEAEGDLKIPDGEQFIFKVQTTYNGVTSTRNVVLEWDNTKDENSIIINNVSLNTAVIVETGWGWRYEPTDDDKDGNPDTMKLVNVSMNDAQNVITFTNTLNEEQWLDTQTRVDNQFKSVPESETTQ